MYPSLMKNSRRQSHLSSLFLELHLQPGICTYCGKLSLFCNECSGKDQKDANYVLPGNHQMLNSLTKYASLQF